MDRYRLKYRYKFLPVPNEVGAEEWNKDGDAYFADIQNVIGDEEQTCWCGNDKSVHGRMLYGRRPSLVCPGTYILKDKDGFISMLPPYVFSKMYKLKKKK